MKIFFSKNSFTYERAPEPSDVYWENLNITSTKRLRYVFLTYLATVVVIGACFGIIYGINLGKSNLNKTSAPKSVIIALSFLCSFVIIIVNKSLNTIVRTLSIKEKHETYTAYNLSVAFKLTLVRFINTAIVPVVVNAYSGRWFIEGGLVQDIFSIMISISFTDPILYVLDFGEVVRAVKKWYYINQGDKCLLT